MTEPIRVSEKTRSPIEIPEKNFDFLEGRISPKRITEIVTKLVEETGSKYLRGKIEEEVKSRLLSLEAITLCDRFRQGVEQSVTLANELLKGRRYDWWNSDEYRRRMEPLFKIISKGQFVAILGPYALNRVAGTGPVMVSNYDDLFPENDGLFLDALTNATVTNFGQGYPLHMAAANSLIRLTGGAQCSPYHPGPLMEQAAEALLSLMPFDTKDAKVAWFNDGGAANSVGMVAAEKYTEMVHGENGRRKVVYFREAYHGNIEGRAGEVTSGINQKIIHAEDRNSIELEFPNKPEEVEPVLSEIKRLIQQNRLSCVVFESTQGDGGGISMHPDFFIELMKLSLDNNIPLICDEVQSGFGRSGKIFDVEYLLEYWRNSPYVTNGEYPERPPMIITVGKSMTNGVLPGSAVVIPEKYAVLERAQGLSTYSAHPGTLAATMVTAGLMQPETLAMVNNKRQIFEEAIAPYIGEDRLIKDVRGHGLHLFLELAPIPNINQLLQVELLGRARILTGTVARDALRVHAPINAPDIVWKALAVTIGETVAEIEQGNVSNQTLQILNSGPSGLAVR